MDHNYEHINIIDKLVKCKNTVFKRQNFPPDDLIHDQAKEYWRCNACIFYSKGKAIFYQILYVTRLWSLPAHICGALERREDKGAMPGKGGFVYCLLHTLKGLLNSIVYRPQRWKRGCFKVLLLNLKKLFWRKHVYCCDLIFLREAILA